MNLKRIVILFTFLSSLLFGENSFSKKNEDEKILKGIFFSSDEKIYKHLEGINVDVDYLPDPRSFCKKMAFFLNKPLTSDLKKNIKKAVLKHFSEKGYKFVFVYLPEKYLGSDVAQVIIINARLGKVTVEGNKRVSADKLAKIISTKPGELISCSRMMKDIYWLNNNPFRSVNLIFEKGKNSGETDVILNVADQYPFRVYSTYEHNGYPIAGNSRLSGGFNLGNLFNLDQQLNYQFSSAEELDQWHANTLSYIIPFYWRHLLKLYAAKAVAKPSLEDKFFIKGKNWEMGVRYVIPFITCNSKNNFIIGYEFKRTNNFMSYSEQLVYKKLFDVSQFILGFEGSVVDSLGYTAYGINFFLSPGNMTSFNNRHAFQKERRGADSDYLYFRGNFDRLLRIKQDFSFFLTMLYQFSTTRLLPSEQMSFGGYFTIRGYLENEVIADRGVIIKAELRSPLMPLFKKKNIKDELQFLAFLDGGYANDVDPKVVKKDNSVLWSIGPGLRYNYKNNVAVRFDYGFQLKTIKRVFDEQGKRSRLHAAVNIAF